MRMTFMQYDTLQALDQHGAPWLSGEQLRTARDGYGRHFGTASAHPDAAVLVARGLVERQWTRCRRYYRITVPGQFVLTAQRMTDSQFRVGRPATLAR